MERPSYDLFALILGLSVASAGAWGAYRVLGDRHSPDPGVASFAGVAPRSPARVAEPRVSPAPPAPAEMAATPREPAPSAVPPALAGEAGAKIWQCELNGQRVFTDFKCAADAKPTALAPVNRMNALPPQRQYSAYAIAPSAIAVTDSYEGGEEAMASTPLYAPYPVAYALRPRPHPPRPPRHAPPHGER